MTRPEAMESVDRIKRNLTSARAEIVALHDLRGWAALGYGSWRECCEREFGFSRQHGYRLIEAARLLETLPPDTVAKESHARALSKVPAEKRGDVLRRAQGEGPVTAKKIEAAARPVIEIDKTGEPIPEDILADWRSAEEIGQQILSSLRSVKLAAERGIKSEHHAWREIPPTFPAEVEALCDAAKQILPYAVCSCSAARKTCRLCRGRGFLSEFRYAMLPSEIRAMRAK